MCLPKDILKKTNTTEVIRLSGHRTTVWFVVLQYDVKSDNNEMHINSGTVHIVSRATIIAQIQKDKSLLSCTRHTHTLF